MKRIATVRHYYDNPGMLRRHLEAWEAFDHRVLDRLSLIMVDDGSPEAPAETVLRDHPPAMPTRLFRIDVDVRWNVDAARNIGMRHAPDGWCLMTDMDHMVPEATYRSLLEGDHDPGRIYRFSRVEHTGEPSDPHPNSWYMTKAMFWRIGGLDEALSGFYGTDRDFRRRCARMAQVKLLPDLLVRYEMIGDSGTRRYLRNQPEDIEAQRMAEDPGADRTPLVLSFPYHEVRLQGADGGR